MALKPEPADFARLEAWGLEAAPLAALDAFAPWQLAARWLKPSHVLQHARLWHRRRGMSRSGTDLQAYYREAVIPHERTRWEFLKRRKAWYIPPWHWERFAAPDCAGVLDVGCGDGDVTQRIAEAIAATWRRTGQAHPVRVVGLDLNRSRIHNARTFAASPHPMIGLEFATGDAVKRLPFDDRSFDFVTAAGVFEALDDASCLALVREIARVARVGVFVEDPADNFPGGFARPRLDRLLRREGFPRAETRTVLGEPFRLLGRDSPCWRQMTMPISKITLTWAER